MMLPAGRTRLGTSRSEHVGPTHLRGVAGIIEQKRMVRGPMDLFVLRTWLQAKFSKDETGASMVEYILLVALIALAVIAAVVFLRGQVSSKFNDAGSKISTN